MGFYDGAKDQLRGKLKAIFENNEYEGEMEEEAPTEFNFTGDVDYTIKVEPEDGYVEYYVMDGDGNIVEIFTDEMAEQSGTLTSEIRQAIVAQAQEELGDLSSSEDEDEPAGSDAVEFANTPEEGEEEQDYDDEDDDTADEESEMDEMAAPVAPPEGGSTETPNAQFATTEVAEDYAHNVRTLEEGPSVDLGGGISREDPTRLPPQEEEKEDAPENMAGVYSEEEEK